ncbi:MAG: ABC transporter ATP-binding protein [Actinobacteria bacterium]|jgi:tungstate transport system ATP-binding protein|nr:MAG: ABC transporter ATP-binding protein [Actinomycetota bacterium]
MTEALVRVEGLRQSYDGRQVLGVDNLEIFEGEILAIVGPNGSGKSTLLRCVNLLETPAEGDIRYWTGKRLSDLDRGERRELALQMAMIFQEPLLFKRSVKANLAYGLNMRRTPKEEREGKVREMLERLNLDELADRDAMTLSGGEAQKVTLGRAMVLEPRLLLMDEPLASLDVLARKTLREDISRLVREMGVTAAYVTHDYTEVLEIADRLAVLLDGELQQVGSPSEVFGRPATEQVAEFLGAENLLEGEVVSCREGLAEVDVNGVVLEALCELPPGSRVKVLIHPEEVVLLADSGDAGSARNRLPARVRDIKTLGALVKVDLQCGFPLVAYITTASLEEMGIVPGRGFTAVIKATAIHVMPFVGRPGE